MSYPRFDLKVPNALPQLVVDRHLCSPSHRRSVEYAGLNHVMVGNANVEVKEARLTGQSYLLKTTRVFKKGSPVRHLGE